MKTATRRNHNSMGPTRSPREGSSCIDELCVCERGTAMYRSAFLASLTTFVACFAYAQTQSATGQASAQGWTPAQQRYWYYTSQGSRLVPLSWLQALEQPTSAQPFL